MINYEPLRILFQLGPFNVYTWGVLHVIAFLVALFFIMCEAKKKKIDEKHIYNIALIALVSELIGSRLFYVFEHSSYFISKPFEIFFIWQGGLTSYGGFIAAILCCWLYIRKQNDISLLEILDISAPWIVLALAIGRIGCFLNWDDYGIQSSLPWAIKVADDVPRHPTQLYLMTANIIMFVILLKIKNIREWKEKFLPLKRPKIGDLELIHGKEILEKPGFIFLIFALMYSIFRFSIDFLRDYEFHALSLALSQWLCIIIFIGSIALLLNIDKIQAKSWSFS